MSYTILIGEYAYSSWSMRGWLLLDAFDLKFRTRYIPMYSDDFTAFQAAHAPARTVPTLLIEEDGATQTVWDSLAIAETLADREPAAGHWPEDAAARITARVLAAEMHSSFRALRDRPSMNLHRRYEGFQPTEAEAADAARVQMLWDWALQKHGGPYLAGPRFTAVDAMFAPVATRFVTFGFDMSESVKAYVEAIYATMSFRRWRACAMAQKRMIAQYDHDLPESDNAAWPVVPVPAAAPYAGPVADAINDACPYSDLPVAEDCLAKVGDRVIGFCNPFCRNKTIADAEAWLERYDL